MVIGVPELKANGKRKRDSFQSIEPIVDAFFDTEDPIISRSELIFDRTKISKSSALCQSR